MNTITYDRREPELDPYEDEREDQPLPRRPRRQFLNRRSAALVAVLTCAAGFYAGVRVEKGQLASTPRTFSLPTASGASSTAGAAGSARSGAARSAATGATGASGATAGATAASRFGGAGGAGASFGTVATVNGKTLVVTEASGNTVKVRLSSSTKITKSQSVSRSAIRPGDTVVVSGVPNSTGTVVAATVSDSGSGSAGGLASGFRSLFGSGGAGGASGASGSGASGSGSSGAVGSLFSGGGSGG